MICVVGPRCDAGARLAGSDRGPARSRIRCSQCPRRVALTVAEQAARAYAGNDKLAALTVAGSVGAGLADGFSDLELDCYWAGPPGDLDRSGPVNVLGGELEALWDYDHDEQEWSDDYRLGDLQVTVSSFLVSTIDRFIDDVVLRTTPIRSSTCA